MSSAARRLEITESQSKLCDSLFAAAAAASSAAVCSSATTAANPDAGADQDVGSNPEFGADPSARDPDALVAALLTPAIRLSAEVLSVKRVAADVGVSYGHSYRTQSESTLALVSIGYGHGVPRKAGNRAFVTWWDSSIAGTRRLPIVGRVAMDVLVVDAQDADICAGADVVLFGDPFVGEIPLVQWAASVGESPVTVVAGIDSRVTRVTRVPSEARAVRAENTVRE
jgi:alanine racemase